MTTLKIKDADGSVKHVAATGAGTANDPIKTQQEVVVTSMPDIGVSVDGVTITGFPDAMVASDRLKVDTPAISSDSDSIAAVQSGNWSFEVNNFPVSFQISNLPTTQTITGSVNVANFPASFQVSNFPTSFQISNLPATQTIAGSVEINNFPASFQVSNFPGTVTANIGTTAGLALTTDIQGIRDRLPSVLASDRLKVDGSGVTQPVSAASLPLPTGAATAANQSTANTTLSSIDGKLVTSNTTPTGSETVPIFRTIPSGVQSVAQSGTWNINNISGTISLPTGAATATNQTTANNSLSSIDSKLPSNLTVTSNRLLVDTGITGGDASAANQATQITKLAEIRDRLPQSAEGALTISNSSKFYREDFPGASLGSDWTINQTGAGQTISVANSELTIAAGTTANSESIITSYTPFKIPFRALFTFTLSQRIVNQEFYLEVVDTSGNHYASVLLDSNINTRGKLVCANNGSSVGSVLNSSFDATSGYGIAELEVNPDEVNLYPRSVNSNSARNASVNLTRQIPDPNLTYYLRIRVKNLGTSPASNTNFKVDCILVQDINEIAVEVASGRGSGGQNQAIPVVFPAAQAVTLSSTNATITQTNTTQVLTSTPLTGNGSYSSSAQLLTSYSIIRGWVETDQSGTLVLEQSNTTSNFKAINSISCNAGITPFEQKVYGNYSRVTYNNGGVSQGTFNIVYSRLTSS